jgi:hypothetical protein
MNAMLLAQLHKTDLIDVEHHSTAESVADGAERSGFMESGRINGA